MHVGNFSLCQIQEVATQCNASGKRQSAQSAAERLQERRRGSVSQTWQPAKNHNHSEATVSLALTEWEVATFSTSPLKSQDFAHVYVGEKLPMMPCDVMMLLH